jgi:hypothetical protein
MSTGFFFGSVLLVSFSLDGSLDAESIVRLWLLANSFLFLSSSYGDLPIGFEKSNALANNSKYFIIYSIS